MSSYVGLRPYEPFTVPQTDIAAGQPVYFFPALAKILTAAEQRIFVAIKSFADYDTGYCYPSLSKIADRAGCHRSTVAHTIPKLIHKGLLRRHRRLRSDVFTESSNGDCFMSNEYCVNMGDKPWPVQTTEPDAREQYHLELLAKADAKAAEYRQSDRYRANLIIRKVKAHKLTESEALDAMKSLLKAPADLVSKVTSLRPTAADQNTPVPSSSFKSAREEIFRVLSTNAFSLTKDDKKKLANALMEKFPKASNKDMRAYAEYLNRAAANASSGNLQIKNKCGYLLGTIRNMDEASITPAQQVYPLPSPSADMSVEDIQKSNHAMNQLLQELSAQ